MAEKESSSVAVKEDPAQGTSLRKPLRIALFGFGTVGSSVARILVESKPEGLQLTHVFNRNVARKRVDWAPASMVWTEDTDAVLALDVDVVVELAGGLDIAAAGHRRLNDAALRRGRAADGGLAPRCRSDDEDGGCDRTRAESPQYVYEPGCSGAFSHVTCIDTGPDR